MRLRLQNCDVTIRFQPGESVLLGDGMSCLVEGRPDPPDVRVNLVQLSADRVEQLREETARDLALTPLRDIIVTGWLDTHRKRFADAVLVISWQVVYWWWRHSERKRPSTCGSFYAAVHLISIVCVRSGTWRVSSQSEGKPALVWDSSRHRVIRGQLHNLPTTRTISTESAFSANEHPEIRIALPTDSWSLQQIPVRAVDGWVVCQHRGHKPMEMIIHSSLDVSQLHPDVTSPERSVTERWSADQDQMIGPAWQAEI